MVITGITQTKRGRYALFCDEKFLFSVDEGTFVEFGLFQGMEIDDTLTKDLEEKSNLEEARAKAYEYLSYRAHTRKELYNKLLKRFDEYTSARIVDEMVTMGYIDEEEYIRDYLEYLFTNKLSSIQEARQYLQARGIANTTLDEILTDYDSDEIDIIKKLVETKYMSRLAEANGYNKVFGALSRRGFRSSEIRYVLNNPCNKDE